MGEGAGLRVLKGMNVYLVGNISDGADADADGDADADADDGNTLGDDDESAENERG